MVRLKRLIEAAQMTPHSLSLQAGLDKSTVNRLLRGGRTAPAMSTVLAIAGPLSAALGQKLTIGQVNGHEAVRLEVNNGTR